MKPKKKVLLLPLLIVLGAAIIFAVRQYAQKANNGLSIAPSNFDLTINPEETAKGDIRLTNLLDRTIKIKAEKRNFTAEGEEGSVFLTEKETSFSLSSWIKITPEIDTLNSRETKTFKFEITPPKNAEPGGHFGSVVFSTLPDNQLKKTGAYLSQEIASLFLVRIPGKVTEKAVVESFSSNKKFYEFGPITFTTRVKNLGGVHIKPYGSVSIEGILGQEFNTNLPSENILPGAVRKINATLHKKFLIGKYTARLTAAYGANNEQLTASYVFYVFPVRFGIAIAIVIFILFLIRKRLGRSLKALLTGK